MNKKIIIVIITIAVIAVSGYFVYQDRAAQPSQDNTDESINGYSLEDDLRITRIIEETERTICVGQSRKQQFFISSPSQTIDVQKEYNTTLPETINNTVQYHHYNLAYDYFLITADPTASLREKPNPGSSVISPINNYEKVTLLQRVEGKFFEDSKIWYRLALVKNNELKEGYVHTSEGVPRKFKFAEMQAAVDNLTNLLSKGELHFISNYKNFNGAVPRINGAGVDEFGYRATHSGPAYDQPDTSSNYRYIPDGILVRILDELTDFYYINVPTFGANYYVPKRYIDIDEYLEQLSHVVVVDRAQQNQAAFELTDDGLNLVSYTLATTGVSAEYSFVTTLGMFKALEKKDRFEYLEKGTSNVAGYAPYAIRFTGGAYIHGVPVVYQEDEEGNKVDPGTREYLHTIGTFPRSSMCVRNYTSHAKFLHQWIDIEHGAVIVID